MNKFEERLTAEGYTVVNKGYPSRHFAIEELAEKVIPEAIADCGHAEAISFVTHSMGGILLRQYLSQHSIENLNHVVMLGPPNQGSEVVDKLRKVPGFRLVNGKAGLALGTDSESMPSRLGDCDFSLGVIAGTRSINWILSLLIPGKDDGKVAVRSTVLAGMRDHLTVKVSHPFLMKSEKVIDQSIYYLKHGRFRR